MPDGSVTLVDGSLAFDGGVDSVKVTTTASPANPNGLKRNETAWMVNCTNRDGGLTQRTGWKPTPANRVHDGSAIFQGAVIYEPDSDEPYIIASIGGHIYKINQDTEISPVDLSAAFGLLMPENQEYSYFCQAENYLVIQAGDNITLPLFWDGTTLRRSKGITNKGVAPGTPGVNEIPAATAMDYFQGRIFYANSRNINAGDIVGGASGTVANHFRDAVLNVTENPMVVGGDGFTLPTNAGNIRALKHSANLDSALGQGNLFAFTRKAVYSLQVPLTRALWIAANNSNAPTITVVQLTNGSVNDRSIVAVNGDLYYQSFEPSIRSLITAVRYFNQPGNIPISNQEQRILQFNDRALMHFASGITYDNRLLECVLPSQKPQGVVHQAILPLDFSPVSTLQNALPPTWNGHYEGLDFLQLLAGDFNGRERAFGFIVSRLDGSIQLWELTNAEKFDGGPPEVPGQVVTGSIRDHRVEWQIEFPAYTWNKEFDLKKLVSAELWVDKLFGFVDFTMEYRPDGDVCWKLWHKWQQCSARNSAEDVHNPTSYPLELRRESYRSTMTLPLPPASCESATGRPSNVGYQQQIRLTVKGWCRIRGMLLHAQPVERKLYENLVCS